MSVVQRYQSLDALRGVLSLVVLFVHTGFLKNTVAGGVAVDIFFVMSGFVVTHKFLDGVNSGAVSLYDVFRSRFIRLYPLHLITFIYMFLLIIIFSVFFADQPFFRDTSEFVRDSGLLKIASHVFFLNGLGLSWPLTYNGPAWTISIEFWLAALLFLLMRVPRSVYPFLVVSLIAATILVSKLDNHDDHYTNIFDILNIGLMRGIMCMTMGYVAYRAFMTGWAAALGHRALWIVFLAAGGFCAALILAPKVRFFFDADILVPFVAGPALVLALTRIELRPGVLDTLLQWLGELSFPLYMWQIPVILTIIWVGAALGYSVDGLFMKLVTIGLVFVVASLSNRWFEPPVKTTIRRWISEAEKRAKPVNA